MFDFFDRETNTKLSLLHILYNEDHWCSTEKLIKKSKLDQRTVLKYLKLLIKDSEVISKEGESLIRSAKGRGYRFTGTKIDYQEINYQLVEASVSFSFITDLFFLPSIEIEDFCERHFVSDTVVKKIVNDLNHFLMPYQLKLGQSKGTITVIGKETAFRYFGYIFFWGLFKGNCWPFEQIISEEQITYFLNELFSQNSLTKKLSYTQWGFILAINICRIKNNHPLTYEELPAFTLELNQTVFRSFDSQDFFKEIYALFPFTDTELNYFALLAQTTVRVYLLNDYLERVLLFHKERNTQIFKTYHTIIDEFSTDFEKADRDTVKIATSLILSTLLSAVLFPGFDTTIAGYDYNDYLYLTFPFLEKEMEKRLNKMRAVSASPLLENQPLIIPRLCELYSLVGHPSDFNPEINIKIETDLPIIMEKVLANQLASTLSPFFKLSFQSPLTIDERTIPDLVIASTRVQEFEESGISITYINPSFGPRDIRLITEKINVINTLKSAEILQENRKNDLENI